VKSLRARMFVMLGMSRAKNMKFDQPQARLARKLFANYRLHIRCCRAQQAQCFNSRVIQKLDQSWLLRVGELLLFTRVLPAHFFTFLFTQLLLRNGLRGIEYAFCCLLLLDTHSQHIAKSFVSFASPLNLLVFQTMPTEASTHRTLNRC
jgi:hypothetical protein